MSDVGLSFRRIEIRRMPGFPAGQGFVVEDLVPGVNVIYGPNASGKTTLSRAIQTLLRPQGSPRPQHVLRGLLDLRGEAWSLDYDVGKVRCQRDGAEADVPALAPADVEQHYVLALHDLIGAEDGADLAAHIVRQSAGGYDLTAARRELGLRERPSGKGKASRELEAAIAARREAERRQDDLLQQERELDGLRRRLADSQAAAERLRWLERAIDLDDARDRHRQAEKRLEAFPALVAEMTGEEPSRLEDLDAALGQAEKDLRTETAQRAAAERRLAESGLAHGGVAPDVLGSLRRKCQGLVGLSSDLRARRQEADRAAAAVEEARQALGAETPPRGDARLDAAAVARLSDFARHMERLRARRAAAGSARAWLTGHDEPDDAEPEDLRRGALLAERWLALDEAFVAASRDHDRRRRVLLISAAGVAAMAVAMTVFAHWSWAVLLLGAAALAVWALFGGRVEDRRGPLRRELEALGVGPPDAWTAAAVRSFAVQLQRRAAAAEMVRERARDWSRMAPELDRLAAETREAQEEKAKLVAELGLPLGAADRDENWLSVVAAGIRRLQEAEEVRSGASAAVERVERQIRSLAEELAGALRGFGLEEATDVDRLSEQVEYLARRQQACDAARAEVASRTRSLERIEADRVRLAAERDAVFARLGLSPSPGDEATLRAWAAMCGEYREAAEAARFAERDLRDAEALLAGHEELAVSSREALEAERAQCQTAAGGVPALHERIGQIEGRINEAKRRTDVEAAIAREARCREALREQRDQDYRAVAGHVLADALAAHERDRERPGVLEDARRLFVQITHGRYRLDIHAGDPPQFRAFDTHREEGLALEQLSSGTRLQLLLAVRVAFVQRQERGVKLPLILDEALGNSDERRAAQIIEAAIQVCRAGRQVFYLTAQHDEVGKWQAILRRYRDVPSRIVDLAAVRRFSETERVPPMDLAPPPAPEIPPPDDCDWVAYGRRLGVPPLDPGAEAGAVHLWYLIDDPPSLYRLLRQGINRWGQLQALAQYGHDPSLRSDSLLYRRADAAARLIAAAARLWRIGRGTPVDRQALIDCPAVSDTYLDRVAALASELEGDAKALLAALGRGAVKGFRAAKLSELEEFLAERGCLDERECLDVEEIRERLRPLAFADLEAGLVAPERFELLVGMAAGRQGEPA